MAVTDESRHHLHQKLDEVLGPDDAITLMNHLPPVGWADVATKRDLDHQDVLLRHELDAVRGDFRLEIAAVRTELRQEITDLGTDLRKEIADFGTEVRKDMNRLTWQLIGTMVTLFAIAMAVNRVG
jgi:hypothetical protein